MSNILSYNNKTSKAGSDDWIAVEPYSDDDIRQIKDPNGGLSRNPRTAIPSPFAQLDLVKNAFAHHQLVGNEITGVVSEEIMVSNALDVAQLFFEYENHKHQLHIVKWNRTRGLEALKSSAQHQLYGETLDLFLRADSVYNFGDFNDWCIIMLGGKVLGGTSPSSLTMAAPSSSEVDEVHVEQGVKLFGTTRHLWQRDIEFVFYLFLLFNAYTDLRRKLNNVYQYMLLNLKVLQREKPALYRRVLDVIPNPIALDMAHEDAVRQVLDMQFTPFTGTDVVNVLGVPLYHRKVVDIRSAAASSDFVIAPTQEVSGNEPLPLVLRNNFNGDALGYTYVNRPWDTATRVFAGNLPLEKRILPDTNIAYPFVTTIDFLDENIIRLSAPIDNNRFFDGNLRRANFEGRNSYLLPIKREYFNYFTADDLRGSVLGHNTIDIEENADGSVTVTLRIPIKKRYIELTRTYCPSDDPAWEFNEEMGRGRVITGVQLSAAVFPFVRTGKNDNYKVQLFTYITGGSGSLHFLNNNGSDEGITAVATCRTQRSYATTYYDVQGTWDCVEACVETPLGSFAGYVLPLWQPYVASSKRLVFAVDFGTTNSHVEWAEEGNESQPLSLVDGSGASHVASLLKKDALLIADQLQRIEFLPRDINEVYGFPLRSSLASNENATGGHSLFGDLNIPFLYERQYFDGYQVATNLKWMGNDVLSKEFLRELVLLIRAKALLENADPSRVRLVYFYPVSMGGGDRSKLEQAWRDLYVTYLGDDVDDGLRVYPESIAPSFYYKGADVAGSSYVSIDIGGGTCDTVVYQPADGNAKTLPAAISSFRFAGNAIFGDAFTERDADNNTLLKHYTQYFSKLVDRNDELKYLNSILGSIMKQRRSEDVNAFLFSLENVEQLRGLPKIDLGLYSYNTLLRNDDQRKLVFMYFYAAIIYYMARAMKHRGYIKPKQIYFSGTGSKILNILGSESLVSDFTQTIIERVYGERYSEQFLIKIERECPKQITCRGGIRLENSRLAGETPELQEFVALLKPRSVNAMKYRYSMIDGGELTLARLSEPATRQAIVDAVSEFNSFFINLCDTVTRDEFGIDNKVFALFSRVVGENLPNYLVAGINSYLQGRYDENEEIDDVPFFYPIIGALRYNLLNNLCNEVISKL